MKNRILLALLTLTLALLPGSFAAANTICVGLPPPHDTTTRLQPTASATASAGAGWTLLASESIATSAPTMSSEVWKLSGQVNGLASGAGTFEIAVGINGSVVGYWTSRVSASASGYVSLTLSGLSDVLTPAARTVGLYIRATGANFNVRPGSTSGAENAWLLIERNGIPSWPGACS
jgi:hypothetical protein